MDLFTNQIPLMRPWIGEEEIEAVREVLLSGWITQGPRVIDFERKIADYVGAKYAVATNSCTTSLHLSLILSGIGPGDEVICPSFTCIATAYAIHHAGATPVFVDIDHQTYNIDPEVTLRALTPRTRGIMLVHQIGLVADVDEFMNIAHNNNLVIIQDAATALGGKYKGKRVGSLGSPTCFSFHPRKMITTGEGGMITTDDERLAQKARVLRATGASISDLERHKAKGVLVQQYEGIGYNYRLTDIQAAIGLVQMRKIDEMLEQRILQAHRYDEALTTVDEIETPFIPEWASHTYTSYLIRFKTNTKINRDVILQAMAERGISCRIGIQPLHWEPFYLKQFGKMHLPNTEEAAKTTMFLPIFPGLREEQQERVVIALKDILVKAK